MKKILLLAAVLIALLAVTFYFYNSNKVTYVAAIDDEVAALETELETLDDAVEEGTLTPTEAAEAQARVVARLNTIQASISTADKATLTPAQRAQLLDGLARLKLILERYRATLTAVDETALMLSVEERTTISRRHGGSQPALITAMFSTTIEDVESHVEDVVEGYDEEMTDPEPGEVMEDSSTPPDDTMDDMSDEEATEDDAMSDDMTDDEVPADDTTTDDTGGDTATDTTPDDTADTSDGMGVDGYTGVEVMTTTTTEEEEEM